MPGSRRGAAPRGGARPYRSSRRCALTSSMASRALFRRSATARTSAAPARAGAARGRALRGGARAARRDVAVARRRRRRQLLECARPLPRRAPTASRVRSLLVLCRAASHRPRRPAPTSASTRCATRSPTGRGGAERPRRARRVPLPRGAAPCSRRSTPTRCRRASSRAPPAAGSARGGGRRRCRGARCRRAARVGSRRDDATDGERRRRRRRRWAPAPGCRPAARDGAGARADARRAGEGLSRPARRWPTRRRGSATSCGCAPSPPRRRRGRGRAVWWRRCGCDARVDGAERVDDSRPSFGAWSSARRRRPLGLLAEQLADGG